MQLDKITAIEKAHEDCVEALLERSEYSRSQNGWDTYTEKYIVAAKLFAQALEAVKGA